MIRLTAPALLLLVVTAPAAAQVVPDPTMEDVAKTPLRDLNIDKRDIPPALQQAVTDPYATAGLGKCGALVSEIAALDTVLGADYDIATDDGKRKLNEGRIGESIVGAIIPFRGVLREVTGAASSDRALTAAYTAGMVRRAFLKGWGMGRGCAYPARPKVTVAAGRKK